MEGNGTEEGAIAPQLRRDSFLIIDEHNKDFEPTPAGEAEKLRTFLKTTISCGRTGSPMPTWAERYGGPLSDTKIDQIVTLLTTPGAWDIYDEVLNEHLAEVFPLPYKLTDGTVIHTLEEAYAADKEATVVKIKDVSTLSLTESNCGQYAGTAASEFRLREPFVAKGVASNGGEPGATPTAKAAPSGPLVKGLAVADFFKANCAVCHGANRQGGVGPPLNPTRLTQPDEFYIDTITNGRPGTAMPSWRAQGLSDEDIRNVMMFEKYTQP
jgi:cytochrome c55X